MMDGAYLTVEARYCVRMYFAPLTGAIRGIRDECRRIEDERRRHTP